MSLSVNNTINGNHSSLFVPSKYKNITSQKSQDNNQTQKLQNDKESEQKIQKKRQITTEQEKGYLCTYLTDDDGKKILLNKIPISQVNASNNSPTNENALDNFMSMRSSSIFGNQLNLEANYRKNSKEIARSLNLNANNYDSSRELKELLNTLRN